MAGALVRPNGITTHSYIPNGVINLVFDFDSFVNYTYQKPDFKSNLVNIYPYATFYNNVSILGKG